MLIRKLKNYIRNKAWKNLKAKWELRSGIVAEVQNDSDWFVFNEIFASKEYDPAFQLFLTPGMTSPLVLDLGANVGYFSLKVADEMILAGTRDFEIISVEASPLNYQVLKRRIGQSAVNNRIKVVLGLVGKKSGSGKVVHSAQHYGHTAVANNSNQKLTDVSFVNLDEVIGDKSKKINLLKCDIEGTQQLFISEYPDLLRRVENAVFEFHAIECDVDKCRRMLLLCGLASKGIIKEDKNYKTSVEIFSRN
jgi:FkbM family methyltransferase